MPGDADDEPAPKPTTHWAVYEDGALGEITVTGDKPPVLSRPGRLVTQVEYQALLTQMTALQDARLAQLRADETAQQLAAFSDLLKAGLSEATARSLSGYLGAALSADASALSDAGG
ncbi:hypothetical protein AB0N14_27340 [Streptomyces sp. NPDC051104]|uniref:hypothetical protein n=1 Tax=Streptomyces sp. NPDC051104 TaxID=3155044 RepID=UPI00343BCF2E